MARINLDNAARYIHGQPPQALDGLFHAVEEKCAALGLVPGRRDNVGVGEGGGRGGHPACPAVESVEPIWTRIARSPARRQYMPGDHQQLIDEKVALGRQDRRRRPADAAGAKGRPPRLETV
jgi:hypothetical protein